MNLTETVQLALIAKTLADGRVSCRVWRGETCIFEKVLRGKGDMRIPVDMSQLTEMGHLNLYPAFWQFLLSDERQIMIESRVCRVIEKFGSALEFYEFVQIELWKNYS